VDRQQKVTPQSAQTYNLPLDPDPDEVAWLVDWNGKLLKTVSTHSRNTSGMAYGGGCVWMGANAAPYGIFQDDIHSKQISHRQIPLSIDGSGPAFRQDRHTTIPYSIRPSTSSTSADRGPSSRRAFQALCRSRR